MAGGIQNPVNLDRLLPLLPAEEQFAACLAAGQPCVVGNGKLPDPGMRVESGEAANVIRANVIRFFAYGGNTENPVLGNVIYLRGALVEEELDLSFARIGRALSFSGCHFAQAVSLEHGECPDFFLDGSRLSKGLHGSGFKTNGSVYFGGSSIVGEVRMIAARIGGGLMCDECTFENPGNVALGFDGASIGGSVLMRRVSAKGQVRLNHARIGEYWDCEGGQFSAPGDDGESLKADGVAVNSDVCLRGGFSAAGHVVLSGIRIGGDLDCTGAAFRQGLIAENMEVSKSLIWGNVVGGGIVSLMSAQVDTLAGDMKAWAPFNVLLDGFKYNRFADKATVPERLHWLGTRPVLADFAPQPYDQAARALFAMGQDTEAREILLAKEFIRIRQNLLKSEFSSSPYEQAAKVLFNMGRPVGAWDILREKRRLERKHDKSSWLQRAWGKTIDTLTDFVYRPLRTVKWTAGIVLAGTLLFGGAAHYGQIVPHQPAVLASTEYQSALAKGLSPMAATRAAFPEEYPEFSPLAFSLDVFIPLFALHQEPFWSPASGGAGDLWKSSGLLAFALLALASLAWLTWLFQNWTACGREQEGGEATWAAFGLAVVTLLLGFNAAAGFAGVGFDFDLPRWLLADWRWLTVWYWIEIGAGWILTSLLLLSVTGLLRPRIGGGD